MEEQTFEDAKFDIVITQDVFEHIYNPGKAFMEIARTLKHGGAHIFTVPILNKFKQTEVWAKQDNKGNPVFLKIEEYHHNPVDKKGSPVTMHWGFDIVNFIREHSGLETIIEIEYVNPINYGIWGENLEVLVSRKK